MTIVSYTWDFGDGTGTTSISPSATKTYAAPGTYPVTLTILDSLGRTATVTAIGDSDLTVGLAETARIEDLRRRVRQGPGVDCFCAACRGIPAGRRLRGGRPGVSRQASPTILLSLGAGYARPGAASSSGISRRREPSS